MSAQCSEKMARVFTEVLLEDAEFPIGGAPAYTYFLGLTMDEAATAYEELYAMSFWDRPRDLMKRMGMDGRVA